MRTKKTVLILISGKAMAGKTTAQAMLAEKLSRLEGIETFLYSFASPLKYICKAFLGWNGEKDEPGRKLLQNIGRDGREYDADVWCKHLINQLDKSKNLFPYNFIIVDDWRFPNEVEFFKKNPLFDVVTVRLFGRGGLEGATADDTSETSLPEVGYEVFEDGKQYGIYDITIENDSSIETLDSKLDIVLDVISKKYIIQ